MSPCKAKLRLFPVQVEQRFSGSFTTVWSLHMNIIIIPEKMVPKGNKEPCDTIEEPYLVKSFLFSKMVLWLGAFKFHTHDRGFHKELKRVTLWNQAKEPFQNSFFKSVVLFTKLTDLSVSMQYNFTHPTLVHLAHQIVQRHLDVCVLSLQWNTGWNYEVHLIKKMIVSSNYSTARYS